MCSDSHFLANVCYPIPFLWKMSYPKYFLYENVQQFTFSSEYLLSNRFSIQKCIIQNIFYPKMSYETHLLFENVLSKTFYMKMYYPAHFPYKNVLYKIVSMRKMCYPKKISVRKCPTVYIFIRISVIQQVFYIKMCFPKHFLIENVLSTTSSIRKCVTQHFYMKMCYPAHFLYKNMLYKFGSMRKCVIQKNFYAKISNSLHFLRCISYPKDFLY